MGLITPALKDKDSGFRYYSADNMTQIHTIRSLQTLGLTLKEISEYYYDVSNIDKHLERLLNLRATLDKNIQLLQARSAKQGDFTVHRTSLPRQVCFCRQYPRNDSLEAASKLRDTYVAAARTEKMSMVARMFTIRVPNDSDSLNLMCCIPVEDSFDGPERIEFAETDALCIYYRGPYEGISSAIRKLEQNIKENNIETTGPFRFIFLEGPPSRGSKTTDYITQVAIPIKRPL